MSVPRKILDAHQLRARKSYGQNFLRELSTARMIVGKAKFSGDEIVVEIGPGLGALTIPLAETVKRVYAVEKDPKLCDILRTELKLNRIDNTELICGSILDFDFESVRTGRSDVKTAVIGNLPYNISSQIVVKLIHSRKRISRCILMFQKELAKRLTAPVGKKDYGRLTVMLKYCADIRKIADVGADRFFPKPKVESEVLEIVFRDRFNLSEESEKFLFSVIKAAFGQRRKTLKNALSGSELHIRPDRAKEILEKAGIDAIRRAETLDVEDFVRLAEVIY